MIQPTKANKLQLVHSEEFKSLGLERRVGGWSLATVYYDQHDKVLRIERTEPNIKAIAINEFKIAVAKNFLNSVKEYPLKKDVS